MIKIKHGLDLPIAGAPRQSIEDSPPVTSVAVLSADYIGMKPTMTVQLGDRVKLGQTLFHDKAAPSIRFTAPASGVVKAINRGYRRVLQSIVIDVDETEETIQFASYNADQMASLSRDQIAENLQKSGLWSAFRTRPFSKIPQPDSTPHSIFVTVIDTHPLAADPRIVLESQADMFSLGLSLVTKLTTGNVYVCTAPGTEISAVSGCEVHTFSGVHPAGLPSTHIHFLDPVSTTKTVWAIDYQDVIAIGCLFSSGQLNVERIISLAGPMVVRPRLIRTRLGASTDELVHGQVRVSQYENRVVSGSVLGGTVAVGPCAYLGRYHSQISVLEEGHKREFMGWLVPGKYKHSVLNMFTSTLNSNQRFNLTTSTNGSERAMVPIGAFENLMPLDILPTQLLRSLVVGDIVAAQELGCLELEEADLALCSYSCAGKHAYGPILRDVLTRIEKEC
jgi:Na+-transporting NADH:ubiquinone oxidoreductase subunit A